ncbi:MAG: lysostaphin resistance A-like protein [Bryobacteraceae bacterium]
MGELGAAGPFPTGARLIPIDVPIEYVVVGTFGPTAAAMSVHWLRERNLRAFRVFAPCPLVVLGTLAGMVLIAAAFAIIPGIFMSKGPPESLHWGVFAAIPTFVNWSTFFGGPVGEEPGWRGYALPRLQAHFGPVPASVILGLVWTGWHLPMFLIKGWVSVSFPIYAAILICASILLTWGANVSRFSVVVPVLLHAAFNTSSSVLGGLLGSAGMRENPPPQIVFFLSSLSVVAAVAAATRGRLGARRGSG